MPPKKKNPQEVLNNEDTPTVSFSRQETYCLLDIWGSEEFQNKFLRFKRHALIFEEIAKKNELNGYKKSGKEVARKISNLRTQYMKLKPKFGGTNPTWEYFPIMDRILRQKHSVRVDILNDSLNDQKNNSVNYEEEENGDNEEDYSNKESVANPVSVTFSAIDTLSSHSKRTPVIVESNKSDEIIILEDDDNQKKNQTAPKDTPKPVFQKM